MQFLLNTLAFILVVVPRLAGGVAVDGTVSNKLRRTAPVEIAASLEKAGNKIIPGAEEHLEKAHKALHDRKVMDAISQFRAEICYKMKQEHGQKFESFDECEKYMEEACNPGKDEEMDGGAKEVTSEKGYCKEYFPEAKKKAEKKVKDEEDLEKRSHAVAPSPGPASGPAPGPAAAAPAPATVAAAPGPAPAPGPMGGPAPAPVPAPFVPGLSAGKPHGTIADDEKYYYKKDGKSKDRFHMDEKMKLPTQGYWGKLVEHEDMKTVNEDWGHEFGPQAGHADVRRICAEHPNNPWCYEQGFGQGQHHRSSCSTVAAHILPFVCAFFAARVL